MRIHLVRGVKKTLRCSLSSNEKNHAPKGRLSHNLCVECFSQLSFNSEMYTKSATAESNESCEKHLMQR